MIRLINNPSFHVSFSPKSVDVHMQIDINLDKLPEYIIFFVAKYMIIKTIPINLFI